MDRNDPIEPMDNTEPVEQMLRNESCDRIDHRDEESEVMLRFCSCRGSGSPDASNFLGVMTPQEERDAAMIAYNAARTEFEAAQEDWDAHLAASDAIDSDSSAAGVAFERLKKANESRQDAVDSLWLAWRNRPDAEGTSQSVTRE